MANAGEIPLGMAVPPRVGESVGLNPIPGENSTNGKFLKLPEA
jgi:hypothetical protein